MRHTPLYGSHLDLDARMVAFAGWEMPLHYGSQIREHHQVRQDAGMFDVSHMTVVDLTGGEIRAFLRYLLANDVGRLQTPGKALYSCMLNEQGGVIDDLIVYFLAEDRFRLVVNAATRDKDIAHLEREAGPFGVTIRERPDLAMIAVQGPRAREKAHWVLGVEGEGPWLGIGRFFAVDHGELFVARTGYTGEDGYEIILPGERATEFWQQLSIVGVRPAGLGARDSLRLEAGMNLYGQDMTEETSPLESGLGWTVAWEPADRAFIGREALTALRGQEKYKLAGLLLEGRGMPRAHQKVMSDAGEGEITSGGFSPTLGRPIALARLPVAAGERCQVATRGGSLPARVVKPPFVRDGKALF
uniref:Aminomethyltransferase n=1 Tax=Candidatus Kentrum sp. DK TaxID=2126562 RepID=A0A450TDG9_9GAMM|nr:MAG: aminomethyltransferase [Candidatus Kentron sp. DK]VFJ64971.1 MAG: aminomethyltransferase [Candidatus Kentron sp. DK]